MISRNQPRKFILPVIVLAQFACTSLWFAGNAVIADMVTRFDLRPEALGHLVSAVQLGFISGTLLVAVFTIADRYSPSRIFCACAIAAALANLAIFFADGLPLIMASRFVTGLFLAGIYPVGMKIASDYHKEGLGMALGWLVGALVLGTAFPHLVNGLSSSLSWEIVMTVTSVLSIAGGLVILLAVPDGPYRAAGQRPNLSAFAKIFRNKDFRSAAFGYFGHMWELYAFWAFVPVILVTYMDRHPQPGMRLSVLAFIVIAAGSIACVLGGYLSRWLGSGRTAFASLAVSFTCCLLSPLFFNASFPVFLFFLLLWAMAVIADSPQFSTLVARSADPVSKGTALTITNCIGFLVTIISIEILTFLRPRTDSQNLYMVLAIGPFLGLISMWPLLKKNKK